MKLLCLKAVLLLLAAKSQCWDQLQHLCAPQALCGCMVLPCTVYGLQHS